MDRLESAAAKFLCNGVCARYVLVNYSGQIYRIRLPRQLMIYARVITTEGADTNYGHIDWLIVWQCESLDLSVQRDYEAAFFKSAICPP